MDLTLRALTLDDVPAWARLKAAVEEVEQTGEHYNEDDLVEELENPDLDPGLDAMGAFAGADLVGFFILYPRADSGDTMKVAADGAVHPEHRGRGVGSVLVPAMLERCRTRRPRPAGVPLTVTVSGVSTNEAQAALLADHGLTPWRWSFVMRTLLEGAPEPRPVADGYEIRRYGDDLAALLREAHNEAFVDHPGFAPWDETKWEQWVTGARSFRPDLSFVATPVGRPTEIAAYVQSAEFDAYEAMTGRREAYVGKVGCVPAHRGRGLASSLLGHALVAYREAGYDEAALDVDSENPTGALGIYRRVGFEVETRMTNYTVTYP